MSDSFDYNFEEVIRLMEADRMRIFLGKLSDGLSTFFPYMGKLTRRLARSRS
ncbi:MAG: hypothetical protein LM600_04830 [Thaumarchaeota archaeon]|nr:hypothetical protein [Nitrososphaerota archaeon]